jgi:hypothetical protein
MRRLGLLLLLVSAGTAAPAPPRLAVLISVDQMRADYLERFGPYFGPDGFNRFQREGIVFTQAHYRHAVTKTGPGHATMLTGVSPRVHGIIGNDWHRSDWPALEQVNCVEDRGAPLVGLPARAWQSPGGVLEAKRGRSPRNLLAETVGDRLKAKHGAAARVFGVSDKDRAAILPSGAKADAAYWTEEGRFVTSTYYRAALPDYVEAFNRARGADAHFGHMWDRQLPAAEYDRVQGPDEADGESSPDGLGRTFPRRVDGGSPVPDARYYSAFDHSPRNNDMVAEFARALVERENLGADDGAPDLLTIGFSQPDKTGHAFGPDSHEVMDTYVRLDRTLADFFTFLDQHLGADHYVVVLTADHGVAPTPEHRWARGLSAGRIKGADLDALVQQRLEAECGPRPAGERWAARDGQSYRLNPAGLAAKGLSREQAAQAMAAAVRGHPAVAAAYTRTELAGAQPLDETGEAVRRSFHRERSGDVLYVHRPYFMERTEPGTTHGTPHDYDTHVPLLWLGGGLQPATRGERVGVDDLAPTLAGLLGVDLPQAEGRRLF